MRYMSCVAVLGDGRPLHVCCRGLGVVRVGAYQGVDGSRDDPPASLLKYLGLPKDGGKFLGPRGPCWPSGVLRGGVG